MQGWTNWELIEKKIKIFLPFCCSSLTYREWSPLKVPPMVDFGNPGAFVEIDLVLQVRDISHLSHGEIVLVTSDDDIQSMTQIMFLKCNKTFFSLFSSSSSWHLFQCVSWVSLIESVMSADGLSCLQMVDNLSRWKTRRNEHTSAVLFHTCREEDRKKQIQKSKRLSRYEPMDTN